MLNLLQLDDCGDQVSGRLVCVQGGLTITLSQDL